jgi:hypothetical protein
MKRAYVGPSRHNDANVEFKDRSRVGWKWFFSALIVFTLIDYFSLSWR